jgi:predicted oxidoreductase
MQRHKTDIAIVGGGIAGIVTALELLDYNLDLTLVDTQPRQQWGGLAKSAFGGMALVGTPEQKRGKIPDSIELALSDWLRLAQFGEQDVWPRRWAEAYLEGCLEHVYWWLRGKGLRYLPTVFWMERGHHQVGNSVPRYHILWGTGRGLIDMLLAQIDAHPNRGRLNCLFEHRVTALNSTGSRLSGVAGVSQNVDFELAAEQIVVASGGIGGSVERVLNNWPSGWGSPPTQMLNGSHPSADGSVHDLVVAQGGRLTHLDDMWNYAAGVRHPRPDFPNHGLSLVPPRSALWLDAHGHRIGPEPLVTGYDTNWLCREVSRQTEPWTWQLLNHKIALRELAVSGAEHNPVIREKSLLSLIRDLVFGNRALVREMVDEFPDVVVADSLPELVDGMNALAKGVEILPDDVARVVDRYDDQIRRGPRFHVDAQLRRIEHLRRWRSDWLRTCRYQAIDDPSARPLMAIREQLITRKSLGGIRTDLDSRVLDGSDQAIPGLYAVGEVAGFGGGGVNGRSSLEGTFLSLCIFTARAAARSIGGGG